MRHLPICLALLGFVPPAVAQEDPYSASFVLPGCLYLANPDDPGLAKYSTIGGVCAGAIGALITINSSLEPSYRICRPIGVSLRRDIRVVIDHLRANPTTWNENFVVVAHLALRQAWPCR